MNLSRDLSNLIWVLKINGSFFFRICIAMWELLVKWRPSDECDGVQQLRGLHRLPGLPLLHGLLLPAEPLQSQGRKQFCRLQPLFSRHFSDLILSSEPPIKSRQAGNKTKKLLNFLLAWQAAGLIRTLSGIIKSLLSSQVDIWVLVASLSPPTPSPPPQHTPRRISGEVYKLNKVWIQESELWIGSYNQLESSMAGKSL